MSEVTVKKIRELESNIDKNVQNTNDIVQLLSYLDDNQFKTDIVIATLQSLRRVFTKIIDKNYLRPKYLNASSKLNKAVETYRLWLTKQYKCYLSAMIDLIDSEDEVCQVTALRIALAFCQKGDYAAKEPSPTFNFSLFTQIIYKLLTFVTIPEQIRLCLKEEYLVYTDMKTYTYSALFTAIRNHSGSLKADETSIDAEEVTVKFSEMNMGDLISRVLYIMGLIDKPVDETINCLGILNEKRKSVMSQKRVFSTLIDCILKQNLTESLIQYILMKMHSDIMPYLPEPHFLADFLTDCYNYGGIISVNALSGLFMLITEYNVMYNDYYDKLYQLLTPEVFEMKYRQRFLTLLVKSLRSSGIPALTLAAFCKRLCRIAVSSSPSTALFIIPLITELITYHTSLYHLIQVEDPEDVYAVVSVRKVLPGVEEDELSVVKSKQTKELEEVEEDASEGEEDEGEDGEEEVVGEMETHSIPIRSTAVSSSELLKKTLARMQKKRECREKELELPPKRSKTEYHFENMKEMVKNESTFDCFDNTASIAKSRALDSYLWELFVLLNHYDPNVVEMMQKLKNKLLKTRQQFNTIVNITYETEFSRLLKNSNENYAFAVKNPGYLGKECLMKKLFI